MAELWHITLLGELRAERGEQVITRFKYQKVGGLLAYLAYHLRQMHSREVLVEMFWPEGNPEMARNSLSAALSSLRHQFEPPGTPTGTVLRADRYSIGLNPAMVTTDVAQFEAAVREAEQSQRPTERRQSLERAVGLYQGRLLPGFYEDWIAAEQERLAGLYFDTVTSLLPELEQQGEVAVALRYARQAVSVDPLREEAHQHLMRLLAATGQPGAALRQYKELERLLEEEMGDEPSAALRALARQIEKQSGLSAPALPAAQIAYAPLPGRQEELFPQTPEQPTTLTFLMTDLDTSSPHSEQSGESFPSALSLYHSALRHVFTRYHGKELKGDDHAFLVAFPSARRAIECAVACQQALSQKDEGGRMKDEKKTTDSSFIPHPSSLSVRMVVHTGDIEFWEGDYRGLALHRASRILMAGHGGQILVSEETTALVRRALPEDIRVIDLGVYRLRDLSDAERLYEIEYPGWEASPGPRLSAEAGYQSHLPFQLTRFFGREQEIAQLVEMLRSEENRLMTLTGAGGTGKTRLALQVAERLMETFHGAVWFVELADLSDPSLMANTILTALRVSPSVQEEALEQVIKALAKQPSLLVLDNFEHLMAGAESVQSLLMRVPSLTILITSRQLLGLSGEREYAVAPLPTPNGGEAPEQLSLFDSVRLFVDRAQTVMPHFQITNHNAPAVAELCQRLEGIPLAIELAAARAQVMTPSQMLGQLSNRFALLASRRRDVPERQRTLQGAMDWSYRLLSPELQRFFSRLAVFRGGWTMEAAETVCEEPLAMDYLAELRECSLAVSEETEFGMRFRMLETVREFGWEQMPDDERVTFRARHAAYFAAAAERLHDLYKETFDPSHLRLMETDYGNVYAGLEWAKENPGRAEMALRFAHICQPLWVTRSMLREGLRQMTEVLALAHADKPTALRAMVLDEAGEMANLLGKYAQARELIEQSVALWRTIGEPSRWFARALTRMGMVHVDENREYALAHYQESLTLCEQLGEKTVMAYTHIHLGGLYLRDKNYDEAWRHWQHALTLARETGDLGKATGALTNLSQVACIRKEYDEAGRLLEESLELARQANIRMLIGSALFNLADVRHIQGDYIAAKRYFAEGISLFREFGNLQYLTQILYESGMVLRKLGEWEAARRQCEESLQLSGQIEDKIKRADAIVRALRAFSELAFDKGFTERAVTLHAAAMAQCDMLKEIPTRGFADIAEYQEQLRAPLSEKDFDLAWEKGRFMSHDQAIAYAQEEVTPA